MFLYIIERDDDEDDKLTDRWHSGGGLIIIARTAQRALDLITEHNGKPYPERSGNGSKILLNLCERDLVNGYYTVVNEQNERLWLFPDAGCC